MPRPLPRSAFVAAALLMAGITLSTFYLLQNYGPESTVRRFHEAVLAADRNSLQAILRDPLDSRYAQALYRQVEALARDNPAFGYRIARVRRWPRRVLAEVQYITRGSQVVSLYWAVEKVESRNWRVNARSTVELNQQGWWF